VYNLNNLLDAEYGRRRLVLLRRAVAPGNAV